MQPASASADTQISTCSTTKLGYDANTGHYRGAEYYCTSMSGGYTQYRVIVHCITIPGSETYTVYGAWVGAGKYSVKYCDAAVTDGRVNTVTYGVR